MRCACAIRISDDRGNSKKIKLFDDPLISQAILHHQTNLVE